MAKWGEIKCPRCEELEAKLRWVMEERDATFALMLGRAESAEAKLTGAVAECERIGRLWHDAEAKLAKAVAMALEECPFREGTGSYNDWWYKRRTTLAKLKGQETRMTDDLVKRARLAQFDTGADLYGDLSDRIEELELEVETWKFRALHQNEVAGRLEAKLTKVEAAIHRITPYLSASLSELDCGPDYIDACNQAFEADSITLAELTGGKDE